MARSKITWEWSGRDNEIIIRKEKGKLTMDDIFNYLHKPEQLNCFDGALAVIMFRINSDRDEPFSLWGDTRDEGDEQAVIILNDDTPCPFCGRHKLYTQYCPDCGHKMVEEA